MEHHLKICIPYHHQQYTAHHLQIKLRTTLKGLRKKREAGYRVSWEPHPKPSTGNVKTLRRDLGAFLDLCIMLEPTSWHVILAQGPCFNGPGNLSVSFLRRGHASMVLAMTLVTLVHFSICADRLCKHTPPHSSMPEGACQPVLYTRRTKVKQKIVSRLMPERRRTIPSATLGQLSHASHTCRSEHYIFSGHFHRNASVSQLRFGIVMFTSGSSELGPTPEPIVSASSSAHLLVARCPTCAECQNPRRRLDHGHTNT